MTRRFRAPSPAVVISIIALLVALSGSAAAATMVAKSVPVNNSDVRFGGHETEDKDVVIKPNQTVPAAIDSVHFTVPRVSSAILNGGFTVTNNSSETVTVHLIVAMNGMSEKYTIDQTIDADATEQLPVAGLLCNGIPAGKNLVKFTALAKVNDGNVTFGFRTVDITEWNPTKLKLGG